MLKTENLVPQSRLLVLAGFSLLLILILVFRFFQLQVLRYQQYKVKSEANIIRAQSIPAPRGLIYDRNGQILVDNRPTYVLLATPAEMTDPDSILPIIAEHSGLDLTQLQAAYDKNYRGRFQPIRLAKDLTIYQLSRIAEHRSELPGISYKQFPERYYPAVVRAAHLIGYIREVDRNFLTTAEIASEYRIGDLIGWRGLEKMYEASLRGTNGVRYLQVDVMGRAMEGGAERGVIKPLPGTDIHTTIDCDLQNLIEAEMEGYRGAVVVSLPQTGEILAQGSFPDYPPDLFSGATLSEDWTHYAGRPDNPLLNRVTHGYYPPGSTFKPLVAIALLENEIIDTSQTITCTGSYRLGRRTFACWNPAGHGKVNLRDAIEQSCNVYFYNMIQLTPLDVWAQVVRDFGFGSLTEIDLPSEQAGIIPDTDFMEAKYGQGRWTKGHLLNIAIGQGDVLVTPIQMLTYVNILANQGWAVRPHLVEKGSDYPEIDVTVSPDTWSILQRYLLGVTHGENGTGKLAQPRDTTIVTAGKTGTSENPHGEPHAWFIGWAQQGELMVSVVILMENSGHGGDVAAPLARKIFQLYFQKLAEQEHHLAYAD